MNGWIMEIQDNTIRFQSTGYQYIETEVKIDI